MPVTNFPNGISSFGMPVLGSGGVTIPPTTGNVFFVDSGSSLGGDLARLGRDSTRPYATIDFAINQTTANQGDIIIVMEGHTENLTGSIALDVAGVSVIGLGQGHTRPRLVHTGTGGIVTITASNCRWSNIVHEASIAAVVSAISVSGPGTATATERTEIDNCHFTFDATGVEFVVMIALGDGATDSADYVTIRNNWFEAENIDGCGSALLIDDCQFVHIRNNLFTGDYNSVCIDGAAGTSACLDYVISDNIVHNLDTGAVNCIDLDDAATGFTLRNMFASNAATPEAALDFGATHTIENFATDIAADVTGIVIPEATAT